MKRLLALVFFMALGAVSALATELLFPPALDSWVAKGQEAVNRAAEASGQKAAASTLGTPKWTVPTGLLTVRDVAPKAPGGCPLADCPPGRLLSEATGELRFSLQVTPLAVAPDTDYAVVLSARDGHVYDSVRVRWSRNDLVGIDPAERSVSKRTETEVRRNRRVELSAPYNDVSVPPFVKDYNQAANVALKAYEVAISKGYAVDPLAAAIITALFPNALEPEDPEASTFDQVEIDRIVNQHFVLEFVEARVFSAQLRADPSRRSRLGQPTP